MGTKKIIIFDDKMFYNAKHLYDYLTRYYYSVHRVTYMQVQDATGKKLKSIDKFFKVKYEYVDVPTKKRIKKYTQIVEGYEEIIAFENKTVDDFILKYLAVKDFGFVYAYRNPKKEMMLAYRVYNLKKLIELYDENLADIYLERILKDSVKINGFYHYALKPTSIKQNIF